MEFYQIKGNHSFIIWRNKTDFVNFLEDYNRYEAQDFGVHQSFNRLSNDISHFVIAQSFIIFTFLSKVLTIDFLEDYNRYNFEKISIELHFSRPFQRYIVLFCSSKIHWFRIFTCLRILGNYLDLRNREIWNLLSPMFKDRLNVL